jgi:RHS repeat-associated protein
VALLSFGGSRWLSQHQKGLEHPLGLLRIVEMGARQYDPRLGRFLEVDPVEAGTSNDYSYVDDPINAFDLDGKAGGVCPSGMRMKSVRSW